MERRRDVGMGAGNYPPPTLSTSDLYLNSKRNKYIYSTFLLDVANFLCKYKYLPIKGPLSNKMLVFPEVRNIFFM